jgi:transposase
LNRLLIRLLRDSEADRMRRKLFWLSDKQWSRIEPHLPTDVRGKERVDDRRVISGILHVLKSGCRWCDCPPEYGPPTTIYNRFVRWAERGVWERLFRELAGRGRSTQTQMIDSTYIKAHRSASGAKRGNISRRLVAREAGAIRKSTQSQMLKAVFFPSC